MTGSPGKRSFFQIVWPFYVSTPVILQFPIFVFSGCISCFYCSAGRFLQLCVCIKWHVSCIQPAPAADVTAIYYSDIASVTPSEIYNTPVLLLQILMRIWRRKSVLNVCPWTWQWIKSLMFRAVMIFYCFNPTQSSGRCISYAAHPAFPIKAYLKPFSTRNNKSMLNCLLNRIKHFSLQ